MSQTEGAFHSSVHERAPVYCEVDEMKISRPPPGFRLQDSKRNGAVAFAALNEPMRSMSTTARKALKLSCRKGARKFPAAPALRLWSVSEPYQEPGCMCSALHDEINPTEFLGAVCSRSFHSFQVPHIRLIWQYFCTMACSCDLACYALCLFLIASDDASIGSEIDQCFDLSTANVARSACTEDDFVVCSNGQNSL